MPVSCPWSGGAKASRCFITKLLSSRLQWLPTHLGQLEPTILPQCRLVLDSCSAGLSPPLSLSLYLALSTLPSLSLSPSLCLSFSLTLLPLRPTLSLFRIKGFSGCSVDLYPPLRFEPSSTGQKRCGIPTELRRGVFCIVVPTCPTPPCMSSPVMHIAVRMGVCSAACRGTAQRLRIPGPPA